MIEKKRGLYTAREWAKKHRRILRFIVGMMAFGCALVLWNAALVIATIINAATGVGAQVVALVLVLIIASWFWRAATDFGDWSQEPDYQAQIDKLSEEVYYLKYPEAMPIKERAKK
jgi:fatty acid desaturase